MPNLSSSLAPLDLLTRAVAEIIDRDHLTKRLETGEKLRVKLGIDPSKPDLHLGHAVPLRKLRAFQDVGHTAVLIIGDYTAQIGDPTDRSEARKMLSPEEVKANAEGYLDQAFKILDPEKTEVHYQSEWYGLFSLRDTIELMGTTTVNHILSHETFAKRLAENQPLHAHEILYPLLQGYDSIQVKSDVELGGVDQKFNVLMGRTLQRAKQMTEQDVMLFRYLPGTDGQVKMSKSLGNTINLTDAPEDMFGKVMSIPDNVIVTYFELATTVPEAEIETYKEELASGTMNPRDIKEILAKQLVTEYHAPEAAQKAATHFDAVFRQKQTPEDIETLVLTGGGEYGLADILVNRSNLVASKREVFRLVSQRGIKKNNKVIEDVTERVSPRDGMEVILQVGPRRFLKIKWKKINENYL